MKTRLARPDELPALQERLKDMAGVDQYTIDLNRVPVSVVEDDEGNIIGLLPIRLIWNPEPLLIFPEVENKMTRRRAALSLFRSAEDFIADPVRNQTGIHNYIAYTVHDDVKAWAPRLGMIPYPDDYTFHYRHLRIKEPK
jgi:hypothetical protein